LTITIDIDAEKTIKALERLKAGLNNRTLIMESIGADVVRWSRDRIRSREHTAPDGSRWESLAAATIRAKQKKSGGHRGANDILLQKPQLWPTIAASNATNDSVSIGACMIYARIHQEGGMAGRGRKVRIPARPYLGVSAEQRDLLQKKVAQWVKKVI